MVERAKFVKHVMVSASVWYGGKGRLHFIPDSAKVNAKLYMETLLPRLIEDCKSALPTVFTFQQDGAPPALAYFMLIFLLIFLFFAIEYLKIYNF